MAAIKDTVKLKRGNNGGCRDTGDNYNGILYGGSYEYGGSRYLGMIKTAAADTRKRCSNMDTKVGEGPRTMEDNVVRTSSEIREDDNRGFGDAG